MPVPYHHGDLRRALLEAVDHEIRTAGTAGLSLRELSRRAGVSHAAPAHHFGDKRGVFTAFAAEGFHILHGQTAPLLGDPDSLFRTGEAYVRFALDHPAHFTVMYDAALLDQADGELNRERTAAFDNLAQAVRDSTDAGDEQIADRVTAAWTVVHGLATLWLGGNLAYPRDGELVHAVFVELAPALRDVVAASAPPMAARARRSPPGRRRPATGRERVVDG